MADKVADATEATEADYADLANEAVDTVETFGARAANGTYLTSGCCKIARPMSQ